MARNSLSIGGARVLLVIGAVGSSLSLAGCVEGLTDNPLTDSEVSAFLTGATEVSAAADEASFAAASATVSLQRDAIVLSRASLDAAEELARAKADAEVAAEDLQRRTDAVRASATADELSEIAAARSAYDEAMKGTSVDDLTRALSAYTSAVVTAETHAAARQTSDRDPEAAVPAAPDAPGPAPAAPQDPVQPAPEQPAAPEEQDTPAHVGTSPAPPEEAFEPVVDGTTAEDTSEGGEGAESP